MRHRRPGTKAMVQGRGAGRKECRRGRVKNITAGILTWHRTKLLRLEILQDAVLKEVQKQLHRSLAPSCVARGSSLHARTLRWERISARWRPNCRTEFWKSRGIGPPLRSAFSIASRPLSFFGGTYL